MRTTIFGVALSCVMAMGGAVAADTCGGTYTVQRGDSLSVIANTLYRNASMWTLIHATNAAKIGADPDTIQTGMTLTLGCVGGLPVGLENGTPKAQALTQITPTFAKITPGTAATRQKINLMTGSDYAPFTDVNLPNGGILADVVNAAMAEANPDAGYAIHWVEGWDSHLEPLLSNALLDMGFPWIKPDCAATPTEYRCANFKFSDPMFEMLMLLFVNASDPLPFAQDTDVHGATLCRPSGYAVHQLDRPDRRWLADGHVTLVQPHAVADCFQMLAAGEVDGVVINEFTGRTAIKTLGLKDVVEVAPRPLAIEGLHVLVHKTHPRADDLIETINAGLRGIKQNGTYRRIVDTHMTRVWSEF